MKKYIKPEMNVIAIDLESEVLSTSMGVYDEGVDFGSMKSPGRHSYDEDEFDF